MRAVQSADRTRTVVGTAWSRGGGLPILVYVAVAAAVLSLVSLLLNRRYRRWRAATEAEVQKNARILEQHLLHLGDLPPTSDQILSGEEAALSAYRASRPRSVSASPWQPSLTERFETSIRGNKYGLAVYAAMVALLMGGVATAAGTGVVVQEVTPASKRPPGPGPKPEPGTETGLGAVEGVSLVLGTAAGLAGGVGGLLGGIAAYGSWRDTRRSQRTASAGGSNAPEPPEPDPTHDDGRHDGYL